MKDYIHLRDSFQICKCNLWESLKSALGLIFKDGKWLFLWPYGHVIVLALSKSLPLELSFQVVKEFQDWRVSVARHHSSLLLWGVCSGNPRWLNIRTLLAQCYADSATSALVLFTCRSSDETKFRFSMRVYTDSYTNGTFGVVVLSTVLLMIRDRRIQFIFKSLRIINLRVTNS